MASSPSTRSTPLTLQSPLSRNAYAEVHPPLSVGTNAIGLLPLALPSGDLSASRSHLSGPSARGSLGIVARLSRFASIKHSACPSRITSPATSIRHTSPTAGNLPHFQQGSVKSVPYLVSPKLFRISHNCLFSSSSSHSAGKRTASRLPLFGKSTNIPIRTRKPSLIPSTATISSLLARGFTSRLPNARGS